MSAHFDFLYVESSIPEGMTVREWRLAGRPSGLAVSLSTAEVADVGVPSGRHMPGAPGSTPGSAFEVGR